MKKEKGKRERETESIFVMIMFMNITYIPNIIQYYVHFNYHIYIFPMLFNVKFISDYYYKTLTIKQVILRLG